MEPEVSVLRPKSEMLDPNFEGYKLNLDKVVIHSRIIDEGILQAVELATSYSYQQLRHHQLHNHLWQDPWQSHRCFFFSGDGALSQASLNQGSPDCRVVLRLSAEPAPVHPSLSVTSEQMALVSDGRGQLLLLLTGDRSASDALWTVIWSDTVLEGSGFVLRHSLIDDTGRLHVLVSQVTETDSETSDGHQNILSWLLFCKDEENEGAGWRLERLRQVTTPGTVHYACLELGGAALCLAADRAVHMLGDSGAAQAEPEQTDSVVTAEVPGPKEKTEDDGKVYTTSELDTCDDFPEEGAVLVRIDGETRRKTHQVDLSSHQYILTTQLGATEQPALCVRHDVDALLWQPRFLDGSWSCEHVGTLQAFGFVQASKTQRKFMACAADQSYAVICDTSRHVFIYHQPSPVLGDLRNRRTGQRIAKVCRQQVVDLDDRSPILGVAAAPGRLCLLTSSKLHTLVLN